MCKDKTSLGCPGNPDPCGCGCQDKAVQAKTTTPTTETPQALVPSGYRKISAEDFTSLTPAPMEDSLEPSTEPSGYSKKDVEQPTPSLSPSTSQEKDDGMMLGLGLGLGFLLLLALAGKDKKDKK